SGDFDGDGFDDLAVGAEGASWAGLPRAGATYVISGAGGGLALQSAELWTQSRLGAVNGIDGSEENDRFGFALATGDFDADGYSDLAVGACGEAHEGIAHLGAVNVIYGTGSGLSTAHNQFLLAPPSVRKPSHYGLALVAGDFDGNGADDLAVGAPTYPFSEAVIAAGLVVVFFSEPGNGIRPTWSIVRDQQHAGEVREAADFAGYSLAAGDFDCDGRDDLVFGGYGESIDGMAGSGLVSVLPGDPYGLLFTGQSWHQDSPGIRDTAERHDLFGWAIAVGDFSRGCDDLAVGVPGEDLGLLESGGAVQLIFGSKPRRDDGSEAAGQDNRGNPMP
ncbi:MAG: integrin alpha, partial [Holophagales bacterium]|nr:integrin alpha [Holophagales bacterium]